VVAEVTAALLREVAHEVETALELEVVSAVPSPASVVVAAATLAGLLVSSAGLVAVAGLVAGLADRGHGDVRAGHGLLHDVRDELVDADADLLLLTEDNEVLGSGLSLVSLTGKDVGDVVLRDGSLVVDRELDVLAGRGARVADEVTPGHLLHVSVAVLAGDRGRVVLGIVERVAKDGLESALVAVDVDRVEPAVGPAGSDKGLQSVVTEAGIGRGVGGSRGDDVHVLRKLLLVPHGARVAGRHEEDKVLEHGLLLPDLQDLSNVSVVDKLAGGHGNDARVAVVVVEDEHIAVLVRLQSLAASRGLLTLHDSHKVLEVAVLASVVLGNTLIDIPVLALRIIDLVVDLAREGIGRRVSKVIIVHNNDVLVGNASLVSKLVGMVDTGLVTVVAPAVAASNKDNPRRGGISLRKAPDTLGEGVQRSAESTGNSRKKRDNKSGLHRRLKKSKEKGKKRKKI